MAGGLALTYAYGLDEDFVEACSLAEDDGLAGLACYAAEGSCAGAGADERVGMHAEFLHACLVAEDASLGLLGTGVYGEDGKASARAFQDVDAKFIDAGALAGTWYAADADADAVATVGQAFLDDFLCNLLMFGVGAFHEGHGLS